MANSALGAWCHALSLGQGKQTASGEKMDRDLVRKYRFFGGRDKNWNRGVSPHVVHYMLAEISVRNKV